MGRAGLWLIGAALAAALVVGCGEDTDARRVTFWTIGLRPTFVGFMEERIESFESAHAGVRVEWVDVPFGAIERKLLAAAAAGREPDVVNLSDMMFARYAGLGAFGDLSGALGSGELRGYHEGALSVGRLGDELLALPWYLTTQTLMFNEELLAAGGLTGAELGSTWVELIDQATPFFERTGVWLFTQPIGTESQLPTMLLAEGLAPFRVGADGVLSASLSEPALVGFLERWVLLYRAGGLPREAATRGFDHLIDLYQDGRVAAVNTGGNFLGRVREVSPAVYAVTGVRRPVVGGLGSAHIAVMPVCVSAHASSPELSRAWALHITSAESQLLLCREAPVLPSTSATLSDGFFGGATASERSSGLGLVGRARAVSAGALRDASAFTPALECWPDLRRVFNERFKAVLLDGADLSESMRETEAEWDRIIDGMNRRRLSQGGSAAGIEALPAAVRRAG